jgi:hypothetical protein
VAIIYRTAGAWGAGKGANLTPAEVDTNFYDLHTRVDDLETNPPAPVEIDDISLVGSQLTITMSDASTFGPFTVPSSRFRWRDAWEVATVYAVNDIVDVSGEGVFLVLVAHTSDATTFDPDAVSGSDPIYAQMTAAGAGGGIAGVTWDSTTSVTPTLEQANYFFALDNGTATNTVTFTIPGDSSVDFPIGTTFHIAQMGNARVQVASGAVSISKPFDATTYTRGLGSIVTVTKIDVDWWIFSGEYVKTASANVATGTYTLVRTDAGKHLRFTAMNGCVVTVPPNADVPFPIGTRIELCQRYGAGSAHQVSVVEGSGVTFSDNDTLDRKTRDLASVMTILKTATDGWDVFGDIV